MPLISRHWAILRLRSIAPLTIVEYEDSETAAPRVLSAVSFPLLALPAVGWMKAALADLSNRFTPRMGSPPVFLDASEELGALQLEEFFSAATSPWWTSRLSRAPWLSSRELTLPLRIVAAGPSADSWFDQVRSEKWAQDESVLGFGLRLDATEHDARPLLHAIQPHIVVTTEPDDVFAVAAAMAEETRPRLVVWWDETFATDAPIAPPRDVSGVALLRMIGTPGQLGILLRNLLLDFTHDLPLHDTAQGLAPLCLRVRLTADPCSVQSLRLRTALRSIRREAQHWETLFRDLAPDSHLRNWINQTRQVKDFLHEGGAFVPIARLRAGVDAAVASVTAVIQKPIAPQTQERAAHVALERLDTDPYLAAVEPTTSLKADSSYQVRLHIGSPLPDSLVESPVPIDANLGPPDDEEGYNLEVAIQGKEFLVESDRVVKLRLPLTGNSAPVYFEVRTPALVGRKELRLCIYHHNYLVQSLLLQALVETDETPYPSQNFQVTTVEVETVQAPGFAGLDKLGERAFSLAVNANGGKTHDFVLKSDGQAHELSLPATTFQNAHDEIRKQLEAAARDPKTPNLPLNYPKIKRGSPTPSDVAAWLRTFATWGHKLYDAFFDRVAQPGSALRPYIVALQNESAARIQVFRFTYEDAFLWPLLYDWDLPTNAAAAPVCLGWTLDSQGKAVACAHQPTSGVYCVRGFWGVRHRIEELLRGAPTKNVNPPAGDKPVRLIADSALPETGPLTKDLRIDLGDAVVGAGPVQPAPLLDVLFKTTSGRPALLILLGHHERQLLPGGLGQSRIKIDPAPEWLSEADVRKRAQKEAAAWSQPRSIILMMACASGTTGAETLTDFTTAWNACGASAIVGTQCVLGSQLAAEFARAFAHKLWKDKSDLGDAMAEIRAELLADGNPLAFLFHAVGDIDLVLQ